jgi:hypothetical protein
MTISRWNDIVGLQIKKLLTTAGFVIVLRGRDDGTNGNNETNGKILGPRFFRLFRHLFSYKICLTTLPWTSVSLKYRP